MFTIFKCGVCPVSTPTVTSVPRCPATLEEMKEAAQRKKCEMMADSKNCDMPPVYHCLLNQWKNDTIEVCASPWYISGTQLVILILFCEIYEIYKLVDPQLNTIYTSFVWSMSQIEMKFFKEKMQYHSLTYMAMP